MNHREDLAVVETGVMETGVIVLHYVVAPATPSRPQARR